MKLHQFIRHTLNENLRPGLLSQSEMIKVGATGSLSKAFERFIPVSKIVGTDPDPADWVDDDGNVQKYTKGGAITTSIEVIYNADEDAYYLQNGNHRLKQAVVNGDRYIRAFVQPDRGKIGDDVKLHL